MESISHITLTRKTPAGWLASLELRPKYVFAVAVLIVMVQGGGFLLLGTGRQGTLFAGGVQTLATALAIGCAFVAFLRSHGAARVFWLLFGISLGFQAMADVGWAYCHYFNVDVAEGAVFPSFFYRLSAAPLAMTLFLSEDHRSSSRLETILDGCIVVTLVSLGVLRIRLAEVAPHVPNVLGALSISMVVILVLLTASVARFALTAPGTMRALFGRLTGYVLVYCAVSAVTTWVDEFHTGMADSVDLLWIVPRMVAGILAVAWRPDGREKQQQDPRIGRQFSLLIFNISMALMVLGSAALGLRIGGESRWAGIAALGIVLVAYATRCALMQNGQESSVQALLESNTRFKYDSLATNDALWHRSLAEDSVHVID